MQRQKPRRIVCALLVFAAACNLAFGQRVKNHDSVATADFVESETAAKVSSINPLGIAIPAAMVTYGVVSLRSGSLQKLDCKTRDRLLEKDRCINNGADNFLCAVPSAAAFAMKAWGVESKSRTSDMVVMFALGNAVQASVVFGAKSWAKRERPDASDCNSFPSAHTAIAFTAAEFLHQEYGRKSPWISIGGYTVATAVGASRIFNNKHWVSDVAAGAGIGILSTKAVYWLYPSLKKKISDKRAVSGKKKTQSALYPDFVNGAPCMKFVCDF